MNKNAFKCFRASASESQSRDPSIITRKIFEVSSFLYKSSNAMSLLPVNMKAKVPPKKPRPPPKPPAKKFKTLYEFERQDDLMEEMEVEATVELDNRSSLESFDSVSEDFEECDGFNAEQSAETQAQQNSLEEDVKSFAKTPRVIQEILESEYVYVTNLKRGIDEFIAPFDSVSLPSALVGKKKILFSNIEVIYRLHESRFYPSLLECGIDPEKIADVFSSFIDGFDFDVYIVYILNRNKSDKLCREHGDFFKDIQKDRLGIGSFLTQPIQRLPKYQLLIGAMVKDLMKDLDENKSAIAACCRAEKHIQRLLNTVNEYC